MRKIYISLLCITIVMSSFSFAFGATKKTTENANYYGLHTDYGHSFWGVEYSLEASYNNSGSPYKVTQIISKATMYPTHTFGAGDVSIASIEETVDYGNTNTYSIKPTANSLWSNLDLLSMPGTKVYFAKKMQKNKEFYYLYNLEGNYYFSVPDVYIPLPNYSLELNIVTPKQMIKEVTGYSFGGDVI